MNSVKVFQIIRVLVFVTRAGTLALANSFFSIIALGATLS